MKYRCRICKNVVKLRQRFSDKNDDKYPKYHIVNGQPCHGFYIEVIEANE